MTEKRTKVIDTLRDAGYEVEIRAAGLRVSRDRDVTPTEVRLALRSASITISAWNIDQIRNGRVVVFVD